MLLPLVILHRLARGNNKNMNENWNCKKYCYQGDKQKPEGYHWIECPKNPKNTQRYGKTEDMFSEPHEELVDKAERIHHIKNCDPQSFCKQCGRVDKETAQL